MFFDLLYIYKSNIEKFAATDQVYETVPVFDEGF